MLSTPLPPRGRIRPTVALRAMAKGKMSHQPHAEILPARALGRALQQQADGLGGHLEVRVLQAGGIDPDFAQHRQRIESGGLRHGGVVGKEALRVRGFMVYPC